MRRFAGFLLVLLALAGFLAAGAAEARMQAGTAMAGGSLFARADAVTGAMPDCPHLAAMAGMADPASAGGKLMPDGKTMPPGKTMPDGKSVPAGKSLAFMLCCFSTGAGMPAVIDGLPSEGRTALRLRPRSDAVLRGGALGPEPPPPRA